MRSGRRESKRGFVIKAVERRRGSDRDDLWKLLNPNSAPRFLGQANASGPAERASRPLIAVYYVTCGIVPPLIRRSSIPHGRPKA